jgi:hypothetical protein
MILAQKKVAAEKANQYIRPNRRSPAGGAGKVKANIDPIKRSVSKDKKKDSPPQKKIVSMNLKELENKSKKDEEAKNLINQINQVNKKLNNLERLQQPPVVPSPAPKARSSSKNREISKQPSSSNIV